jgi:ABC-type nitrate/sulfonate/bicarbonate transport system substrate-binding protein
VDLLAGGVGATSAEAMVLSRSALVGLSAPNATAPAIVNEQAPLKIIGSTFQKGPFCIVSLEEGTPITSPAEMAGKRIGVQTGTNEEIFAGLLAANGMAADDLTIVPVQFDPMVVATGDVDGFMAYITNEPILLAFRDFHPVTFLFADHGLPLTAETFTVLQEEIDTNRDKLKAFLKAEILGWTDAVNDPEESARLAVEEYGKEYELGLEEQIEEMHAQNELVVSPDTEANGLFTMTDQLITAGIEALNTIDIPITAEELYDFSLLEEVYAENPELAGGPE